eukprot:SAG11_NODE_104_length_16539_cov_8.526642_15_plen_236_part_00
MKLPSRADAPARRCSVTTRVRRASRSKAECQEAALGLLAWGCAAEFASFNLPISAPRNRSISTWTAPLPPLCMERGAGTHLSRPSTPSSVRLFGAATSSGSALDCSSAQISRVEARKSPPASCVSSQARASDPIRSTFQYRASTPLSIMRPQCCHYNQAAARRASVRREEMGGGAGHPSCVTRSEDCLRSPNLARSCSNTVSASGRSAATSRPTVSASLGRCSSEPAGVLRRQAC